MDIKSTVFNKILPFVGKPGQYIGNEINMIRKDLASIDVRVALVFPDVYEIGMSYMGFPILYNRFNSFHNVYAERAFSPWTDMEAKMRDANVPLYSLETFSPLTQFDLVGFTFQYELHYATILNLLDLAGIPVESREREGFPLVMAGGPSAFNPEPMADFIDFFVLGDAEVIAQDVTEVVRGAKKQELTRKQTLARLAEMPGIYVPEFYQDHFTADGRFAGLQPIEETAPARVRAQIVPDLYENFYPERPLVPMIQTTHDRISLEIARGCSRGCRFCNAGMIYRPVRQRSPQDLLEQARKNIQATGYEEISLVSLSTSDYTQLGDLMQMLHDEFAHDNVSISFPSLRPESFTPQVAKFAKGVRKSGLTLAPEAGSQRLRNVINKATTEEELLRAVDLAFQEGWNLVKLYFMIGQPTETDSDLQDIVDLVHKAAARAKRKGKKINVSVSPFIPKAGTPFQWVKQDSMQETRRKIDFLKEKLVMRNVRLSWREPDVAEVEGVLARGDRRMGRVIKKVWTLGANLEGWSEFFNKSRYDEAMRDAHLSYQQFNDGYDLEAPLPWDHVDKGITKRYLQKEYHAAFAAEQRADCRFSECHQCGLMKQPACMETNEKNENGQMEKTIEQTNFEFKPVEKKLPDFNYSNAVYTRIHYSIDERVKFLSHLDRLRMFERVFRRAQIPLVFTQGYNPHPKMIFGPSLATGFTSTAEYIDVQFYQQPVQLNFKLLIPPHLPEGIEILNVEYYENKRRSLASILNRAEFHFDLEHETDLKKLQSRIKVVLSLNELLIERKSKKKLKVIDIRPFIFDIFIQENRLYIRTIIQDGKSVRMDELLSLLFPESLALITNGHRSRLWVEDGSLQIDPLVAE